MKIIQFDGGAVLNPGTRGIGIILLEDNHVLKEISRKLDGIGTNNEAEYSALIEGLKQALALGWKEILVQGDSKLVVNHCCSISITMFLQSARDAVSLISVNWWSKGFWIYVSMAKIRKIVLCNSLSLKV